MSANNTMQVFCFKGHDVRAIHNQGEEPLLVAKDVAEVLGYRRTTDAIKQHCKGAVKHRPLQTDGGVQKVRVIDEPDLYRLVIGSKLPAAEKFERWVFEEVLPAIRKNGSYSAEQQNQIASWQSDITEVANLADGIIAQANTSEQEKWNLVDRLFCKLFEQGIELIGGRREVVYPETKSRGVLLQFSADHEVMINPLPIQYFLKESCVADAKLACSQQNLYQNFCIWWQDHTKTSPPDFDVFCRSLLYKTITFVGEPWFLGLAPKVEMLGE